MAEEKIGGEATESDQSTKVTESYDATRQKGGEYYDYGPARVTAGEYYETTRELAAEFYDTAKAKAGEVVARSRPATTRQAGGISAAIEAVEAGRLVDVTGQPLESNVEWRGGVLGHATPEGFVNLTISRGEFDRLSTKTREILTEAALAQERIAKDQEEIDLLKTETREMLRRLRAA
jgi:hypothetical protein